MNVLKKLLTALRGGVREVGEAVIDANSMRIYEQEIEDAKAHIETAKESLTTVMAQEMQKKRDLSEIEKQISENEAYAREALKMNNESLAMEVAEKIAKLENQLAENKQIHTQYVEQMDSLKSQIREAEKTLAEHQRQLAMVKTTDSVQKATLAISENIASNRSQLNSAKESLERIRQRQQLTSDKLAAGEVLKDENEDVALANKLKDAGITQTNSAASVLDRLKSESK